MNLSLSKVSVQTDSINLLLMIWTFPYLQSQSKITLPNKVFRVEHLFYFLFWCVIRKCLHLSYLLLLAYVFEIREFIRPMMYHDIGQMCQMLLLHLSIFYISCQCSYLHIFFINFPFQMEFSTSYALLIFFLCRSVYRAHK